MSSYKPSALLLVILVTAIVLVMFFAAFLVNGAPNIGDLAPVVVQYLLIVATRLGTIIVISLLLGVLLFDVVLGVHLNELAMLYKDPNNRSHAILTAGVLATAAILAVGSHGPTTAAYLFSLLNRGAFAIGVMALFTVIFARAVGLKSLDEFRGFVEAEHHDSHAILIASAMVVITFVFMYGG